MTEQEKRGMFARLKEILYGMGAHDMSRYALRTRASMEHLFILITMGDLIGVPILPPYYSLRLLPYVASRRCRKGSIPRNRPLAPLSRKCRALLVRSNISCSTARAVDSSVCCLS